MPPLFHWQQACIRARRRRVRACASAGGPRLAANRTPASGAPLPRTIARLSLATTYAAAGGFPGHCRAMTKSTKPDPRQAGTAAHNHDSFRVAT